MEKSIKVKIELKDLPAQYVGSVGVFLGKLMVAEYFYDGMKSKTDLHNYKVVGRIPLIKSELGKFVTKEECEKRLIEVANYVLGQIGE